MSAGCKNCYAETFAERWRGVPGHPYEQGFDLKLWPDRLVAPLTWKRNKPRTVFVNSMSDLFHEKVPFEFLVECFAVMVLASAHTFIILTKRAERMCETLLLEEFPSATNMSTGKLLLRPEYNRNVLPDLVPWPLPNVWLGVSCENQEMADARLPWLFKTPAAIRFASFEPLLGPIEYTRGNDNLDWAIIGGESGHGAGECQVSWISHLAQDLERAEVPTFVKQLGANPIVGSSPLYLENTKGADPSEWPSSLRIRQWPVNGATPHWNNRVEATDTGSTLIRGGHEPSK